MVVGGARLYKMPERWGNKWAMITGCDVLRRKSGRQLICLNVELIDKEPKPLFVPRNHTLCNESLLTSTSREIKVCKHERGRSCAWNIFQVCGVLAEWSWMNVFILCVYFLVNADFWCSIMRLGIIKNMNFLLRKHVYLSHWFVVDFLWYLGTYSFCIFPLLI